MDSCLLTSSSSANVRLQGKPTVTSLSFCRVPVTVTTIYRDDNEVQAAKGGENLRLRLGGVDEDEVSPGFVLCSRHLPVPAVTYFDAQLHLLDLLEHKSLFSAGYKAILHIHAAVEECEITALLAQIDPKTKQKKKVCGGNTARCMWSHTRSLSGLQIA